MLFIDTYHLFDETHTFLAQLEGMFNFKAVSVHAKDFATKEDYKKVHGSDLFMTDIEKYDQICKVRGPWGPWPVPAWLLWRVSLGWALAVSSSSAGEHG